VPLPSLRATNLSRLDAETCGCNSITPTSLGRKSTAAALSRGALVHLRPVSPKVTFEESTLPLATGRAEDAGQGLGGAVEAHSAAAKSSILLVGSFLAMCAQGVSSLAIAAALTPSERGNYTLAINVPVLLVVLVSGGLLYSVPYLVRRRGLPASAIGIGFAAALVASALAGLLIALAFWFQPAHLFDGADQTTAVIALGAAVLAGGLAYCSETALAFDAVRQYVAAILIQPLVLIVFLGALIIVRGGLTATSSEAAWLASVAMVTVFLTMVLRRIARSHRDGARRAPQRRRVITEMLQYTWRTQAAVSLQHLAYRSDLLFAAALLSSYQLGLYAIATFVAEVSWMPATAASQALFADLLGTASARRTLLGIQNSLALTVACAGAVLVGSVLLFAGILSQYAPALPATAILLPGVVLASISRPYSAHLIAMGRAGHAARLSATGAVAGLVLYPVAIITHGIIGAAAATSIVYALQALYATVGLRRERPHEWTLIFRFDHGYKDVVQAATARIRHIKHRS